MQGGPFKIDSDHKSILRKSDLAGRGQMLLEMIRD